MPFNPDKSTRIINHLPPPASLLNYTPYKNLEFNWNVQEYCRNRNNHISRKSSTDSTNTQKSGKQPKTIVYNSVNTPFNKVVRSCKLVVSGDVAVGKTCLVNRFGRDVYSNKYQTTIGVDFDIQKFNILGQPYVLQVWDTAGLERFKCITSSYYRGCEVALLVFDVSNLSTLANVLRWKEEVLTLSKTFEQQLSLVDNQSTQQQNKDHSNDGPLLFLVGTKSDLSLSESSRLFIQEQANKIANLLQAELWFVSAQTGQNVNELFNRIAALTFNRCITNEIQRIKFENSTLGACLKEKIAQQQKELWYQSSKLIKITRKKDGDDRRSKCVNVQCVIK